MILNIPLPVLSRIFIRQCLSYVLINFAILFNKYALCMWSQHAHSKTQLLPVVLERYAKPHEFPFIVSYMKDLRAAIYWVAFFQVSIQLKDTMWFPICVGSIVGPRTIVTAALCFGEPST